MIATGSGDLGENHSSSKRRVRSVRFKRHACPGKAHNESTPHLRTNAFLKHSNSPVSKAQPGRSVLPTGDAPSVQTACCRPAVLRGWPMRPIRNSVLCTEYCRSPENIRRPKMRSKPVFRLQAAPSKGLNCRRKITPDDASSPFARGERVIPTRNESRTANSHGRRHANEHSRVRKPQP